MTRADLIRSMDDVELSAFLCDLQNGKCSDCQFHKNVSPFCGAMDYLHEEVKGAHTHEEDV